MNLEAARPPVIAVTAVAMLALSAACAGGGDERYPPFVMTYVLVDASGQTTWELEYRSADDWVKTLVADTGGPDRIGQTARWDGEQLALADSLDGDFVVVRTHAETAALPEGWFAYEPPNDLFHEVASTTNGARTFRNEFPVTSAGEERTAVEVVTIDGETDLPIEWFLAGPPEVIRGFFVTELAVVDGDAVRRIASAEHPRLHCASGVCLSEDELVRGAGAGVEVVAWGFDPDAPAMLHSTDKQHEMVQQHVRPDGTVRFRIDPVAPRPPGEEYALVQQSADELVMRYWRLGVREDHGPLAPITPSDFRLRMIERYR